jgi:pyruvate/2-oxoglutarate dehydrogenase complex dihydrolipoamide dehydrogenase (E3) component
VGHELVVIGAGSAGLAAASFGPRMGARIALIDARRLGGDYTWTGCVPGKALIHAPGRFIGQDERIRRLVRTGRPRLHAPTPRGREGPRLPFRVSVRGSRC